MHAVQPCCECRYIQVAELEQCWRNNDASFVVPDCESEVCLLVKLSEQKIRVQQTAQHDYAIWFQSQRMAKCAGSQSCLLQYMQLFQILYKRGTEQSHSTKTVQAQVSKRQFLPLSEFGLLHVEQHIEVASFCCERQQLHDSVPHSLFSGRVLRLASALL